MSAYEKLTTAEDIKIYVPPVKEAAVRDIAWKHKLISSGLLGKIKTTELRIDLKPESKQLNSPAYRTGPKTRAIERSEIDKQLIAGVIEPPRS